MAILVVRTDEDPILRKKSREVNRFDDELKLFIDDMYETMYDSNGVGLAAVQVGRLRRILVVDDYDGNKMALVNPEILDESGCEIGTEGCLSVPGKIGEVERSTKIKVKHQTPEGEEAILEAEDFFARIIQHELDHLNGVLYTDRAENVRIATEEDFADKEDEVSLEEVEE